VKALNWMVTDMWTPDRPSPAPRRSQTAFTREPTSHLETGVSSRESRLAAIELRYLARLLGRPPTPADASLLPGVKVSDL